MGKTLRTLSLTRPRTDERTQSSFEDLSIYRWQKTERIHRASQLEGPEPVVEQVQQTFPLMIVVYSRASGVVDTCLFAPV